MFTRLSAVTIALVLNACAAGVADPPRVTSSPPLDVLPPGLNLAEVRADIVKTAQQRYGIANVTQGLASPTYVIVKRFAGMAPPPPAGAGPGWTVPTRSALLTRDSGGWQVATSSGWRPANAEVAGELDRMLSEPRLWSEPSYIQACPDFGSSNLILKVPRRAEIVRNAQCSSASATVVELALRA